MQFQPMLAFLAFLASIAIQSTSAFPHMGDALSKLSIRQTGLPLSADEPNNGIIPNLSFDPVDQYVNVSPGSPNEFVAPLSTDERGPCPGLNAAANHGFIPHNGIVNTAQIIAGLGKAYAFGPLISTFLSTIGIALTGDLVAETWSIGGPFTSSLPLLLSNPEGISYSHNQYEGDRSPTRMDAYLNDGDAYSLNLARFKQLYFSTTNFTLDALRDHAKYTHDYSIANNPYFFDANFGGVVAMATYSLIPQMFSNHSTEYVQGYLDRDILKSFFSVTGPDDALVYTPGYEQIPQNWYRRPSSNPLDFANGTPDLVIMATKYPELFSLGGNTGTVNSFTGVDLGTLTGGIFHAETLLEGNNLACFLLQAAQQGASSSLAGLLASIVDPVLTLVNNAISPVTTALACPAMFPWDTSVFSGFPGASYHPAPASEGFLQGIL